MRKLLFALLLLVPSVALAQSRNTVPPTCTAAELSAGTCAPALEGTRVHITDGDAVVSTDCTTGGGAADIICEYDGSAWVTAPVLQALDINTGDIAENAITADELGANVDELWFCGELGNAGATYGGPNVSFWTGDYSASGAPGGAACNTLGDATETNVDNDVDAFLTFKVMGMYCWVTSAPSNAAGVIMVLHDDTAVTTPSVTCTVAQSETSCTSTTATTTDVAANSQLAVEATTAEDLSTQDFGCRVWVSLK